MLKCFSDYLSADEDMTRKLMREIRCQFANIVFDLPRPVIKIDLETLEKTELRDNCYRQGAVKLWVKQLGVTSEKAKHFYKNDRKYMHFMAIEFLKDPHPYPYAMCHLFGDIYNVEVYLDGKHVQSLAMPGLLCVKQNYSIHIVSHEGTYTLEEDCREQRKKPIWYQAKELGMDSLTVESVYSFYAGGEFVSNFVPPTRKNWCAHRIEVEVEAEVIYEIRDNQPLHSNRNFHLYLLDKFDQLYLIETWCTSKHKFKFPIGCVLGKITLLLVNKIKSEHQNSDIF